MWILPKQLHTSAYVADMTALGLDCEEFGQQSERSLMWRSKPSQARTWSQRWKRESWVKHLSGRILRRSQHGHFVDAWTSLVRDSRASRSPVQEPEQQTTTPDTSGPMSDKQLDLFDQGWLCLRTSKESSAASSKETTGTTRRELRYCSMSLESWKEQVTAARGAYSQRVKSGQATSGSGCSSLGWRTPQANPAGISNEKLQGALDGSRAYNKETGSECTGGLNQEGRQEQGGSITQCSNLWPARPGEEQHEWEEPRTLEPGLGRATNGTSSRVDPTTHRVDRLRLLGNGVVSQTAEKAVRTLYEKLTRRK